MANVTPGFRAVLMDIVYAEVEREIEAYYRYDPAQVRARIKAATERAQIEILTAVYVADLAAVLGLPLASGKVSRVHDAEAWDFINA